MLHITHYDTIMESGYGRLSVEWKINGLANASETLKYAPGTLSCSPAPLLNRTPSIQLVCLGLLHTSLLAPFASFFLVSCSSLSSTYPSAVCESGQKTWPKRVRTGSCWPDFHWVPCVPSSPSSAPYSLSHLVSNGSGISKWMDQGLEGSQNSQPIKKPQSNGVTSTSERWAWPTPWATAWWDSPLQAVCSRPLHW